MNIATNGIYSCLPTRLQNAAISLYGRRLKRERFCKRYFQWQRFLLDSQYYSKAEIEEYQNERLRQIIATAYDHVPYYRELFEKKKLRPADFKRKEDLQKLPVLTRDDVKRNSDNLVSRAYANGRRLDWGHTSGTTGSPLEVAWDTDVSILHNVALWRHRGWAGFKFGDRYATLLGRLVVPISQQTPPFFRVNRAWNQYLFSSFHLTDRHMMHYLEELENHGIEFMEAYPSTAYILAKYLEQHNLSYKMKAIVTSSETLLPVQRETIERSFQCKVLDYYGMAERVMFSGECVKQEGHHLFMEYGITEILNSSNEPVRDGEYGKLVLTGLHNQAMPLIRYDIGDISALKNERCSCGRTLPLLKPVTTKAEDIVVTKDGRLISPSVLTHPFKPMSGIAKSQIVQEDYDHLVVRLVKRPSYAAGDTEALIKALQERVGAQLGISIEFVDDIPLSPNGKFRWVISKIPLTFGPNTAENLFTC